MLRSEGGASLSQPGSGLENRARGRTSKVTLGAVEPVVDDGVDEFRCGVLQGGARVPEWVGRSAEVEASPEDIERDGHSLVGHSVRSLADSKGEGESKS